MALALYYSPSYYPAMVWEIKMFRVVKCFAPWICLLGFSLYSSEPAEFITFNQWQGKRLHLKRSISLSVKKTGPEALHERRRTRGSGLCGSPEEVVVCQCWEERASTWSGCSTHSEAKASHSVGVVRHVAAHDLSLSCKRVKLMIFSATAALLTFAQASESLP